MSGMVLVEVLGSSWGRVGRCVGRCVGEVYGKGGVEEGAGGSVETWCWRRCCGMWEMGEVLWVVFVF